jgi:hypothetical protein
MRESAVTAALRCRATDSLRQGVIVPELWIVRLEELDFRHLACSWFMRLLRFDSCPGPYNIGFMVSRRARRPSPT